uniref:Polyphenol oxidase C-terminal domain-containing protein n=1 Tax=Vitis vinifera TaxID=29760 RepID=F6I2B5_VITVI
MEVDIPWLKSRPKPRQILKKVVNKLKHKSGVANAAEIPSSSSIVFPIKLDSTLRVDVPRPRKSRSKKEKEDEEEVLVIKGIELERDKFVKFDIFINDEDDPVSRPDNTEFAGSFVNVPHQHSHGKKKNTILRIGISELLEDLEAEDDDSVVVTLVPRYGADVITIGGIEIELAS